MKRVLVIGFVLAGCDQESDAPASLLDGSPLADPGSPPVRLPGADVAAGPIDGGVADAAVPDVPVPDAGPPLPDLTLLEEPMSASVMITQEGFAADHCALNECLQAPGMRRLLRFATAAANVGSADLVLGDPQPSLPEWEYDACHMHYHYLDFADYQLVRADDTVVALGHKQSFCLRDDQQIIPGATTRGYDCTNQGLSVGWADIYGASLDCQFIDITGVPPGPYLLRVQLNPGGTISEERVDNNTVLIPVVID